MQTKHNLYRAIVDYIIALEDSELELRNKLNALASQQKLAVIVETPKEQVKVQPDKVVQNVKGFTPHNRHGECVNCGKPARKGSKYCPDCAKKLCITCGAVKTNNQPYCTKCAYTMKQNYKNRSKQLEKIRKDQPVNLRP